ncbi:OpgC family protein [Aureimonas populi]|uniref:OpgC family protein n=1 Tax=Aureimonas populi TaxID=1701758 RepID=A0ABW5CNF4_9HYPH|nr:OpgC domain-containing protein [Aureimonas populi]
MTQARTAPVAPVRDHRIDFYRGIALAMIFVNHIPGVLYERFTSRNFGFSDSAELFVFLAGFASAYAYGRPFLAGNPLVASIRALRRAGVLYLVHMALTMATIGLFVWAAMAFGEGALINHLGLGHLLTRTLDTLLGLATLGHQFGYVNILPMYMVLLVFLPALLLILRAFGARAMMAASVAFWIACGVWRLNMPNYPNPGGWFFNPFAWQVIFAAGLYCGLMKMEGKAAIAYRPWVFAAALAFLAYSLHVTVNALWHWQTSLPFHFLIKDIDKTFATLPRVLHLLALVYVFAYLPRFLPSLRVSRENPLAAMGRHSLPVFALGTMLSLSAQVVRFVREPGFLLDTALVGGGLLLQVALAAYLDWWRVASRKPRSQPAERMAAGTPAMPLGQAPARR